MKLYEIYAPGMGENTIKLCSQLYTKIVSSTANSNKKHMFEIVVSLVPWHDGHVGQNDSKLEINE